MSTRKEGYYWVKYLGEWTLGKFQKGLYSWYLIGHEEYFKDGHFDEIDENQIVRIDPIKSANPILLLNDEISKSSTNHLLIRYEARKKDIQKTMERKEANETE